MFETSALYAAPLTLQRIPEGDPGTLATLDVMARLAREGSRDPVVIAFADEVMGDASGAGDVAPLRCLRERLAELLVFTEDPARLGGVDVFDVVHTPRRLVEMIEDVGVLAVDCDDVAVLAAACARSRGYATRFVVVALDKRGPYTHVWAEARSKDAGSGAAPSRVGAGIEAAIEFDVTRPFQAMPVASFVRPVAFPVN